MFLGFLFRAPNKVLLSKVTAVVAPRAFLTNLAWQAKINDRLSSCVCDFFGGFSKSRGSLTFAL